MLFRKRDMLQKKAPKKNTPKELKRNEQNYLGFVAPIDWSWSSKMLRIRSIQKERHEAGAGTDSSVPVLYQRYNNKILPKAEHK
jgi:hypothetical protein